MNIELLKPHTHAGVSFAPGDLLVLDEAAARWLIDAGVAKATDSIQQAEQTAADKANTEKVYAQALSTLWLAQQAAQTQASQNNSDANQASLALAQTALAQAISQLKARGTTVVVMICAAVMSCGRKEPWRSLST